jgi:hypothetical protein
MWHSGKKSQRRQSAILPASIRSFFLLGRCDGAQHQWMRYLHLLRVRQQMIVDPAGENPSSIAAVQGCGSVFIQPSSSGVLLRPGLLAEPDRPLASLTQ